MFSNDLSILLIVHTFLEDNSQIKSVWRFKRQLRFMRNKLLGSYSNKMLRDRMRVNKETFSFLCETLRPSIKKFDTPMTASVDAETRVAVTFARLATGNTLSMIGDLYGIDASTAFVIVRICYKAIKEQLLPIVIEKMNPKKMKTISTEFEVIRHTLCHRGNIRLSHTYRGPWKKCF